MYVCRQQPIKGVVYTRGSSLIMHKIKVYVYTTQVQMSMSTVPTYAAGVAREVTKCIRQAANNVSQPCQWPSHQIHRISRGTSPQTSDQNRLPCARLCSHHHQSQRDGPPSWGQGTQQPQDDRMQHTSERH